MSFLEFASSSHAIEINILQSQNTSQMDIDIYMCSF